MLETLLPHMAGGDEKRTKKAKSPMLAPDEMRELASSLERVPAEKRTALGDILIERTWTDTSAALFQDIARVGARIPSYASAHHVVPPARVEAWIDQLLRLRNEWGTSGKPSALSIAALRMARMTGDRARDLSPASRARLEKKLREVGVEDSIVKTIREVVPISEAEKSASFGDSLPVGLRIA
jgi:hypothetical protein